MSSAPRFPNVVIRASAGTGKTFQLTNRFIALAANGEPLETILATTFTRKAAGEILGRVLLRLAKAGLDPAELKELVRHVPEAKLDEAKCLALLRQMVRQLHRLRVGTLDSFFLQAARSFSLELGLAPGWQILDEVVDNRLRAQAVRIVLEEGSPGDILRLMHLLTKGEAARNTSAQILSLVKEMYDYYLEAPPEAWYALPRQTLPEDAECWAARQQASEAPRPPEKRWQKAVNDDLARFAAQDWEEFLKRGLPAKLLDGSRSYYKKPIPDELAAAYEVLVAYARGMIVNRIANQTEARHRLLARFDAAYQRLKAAERGLRFDDVTRTLADSGLAQRLDQMGYRLDAGIAHLLLDEFQDTSPQQWRAIQPLAKHAVASPDRRSFFCVGDVKQAIYGWRGGVAEIVEAIDGQLDGLAHHALNQSWRSSQPVIDTVNRVFAPITENPVFRDNYAEAAKRWAQRFSQHTTALAHLPGYCRLLAAPRAEQGQDQADLTLRFAAQQVAELVREAPGLRIGVLVRRNVDVARTIYELRKLGVNASEEGGNPLTNSPAVECFLALLTLADHPGDTAARFRVAHCPLGALAGLTSHNDSAAARRLSHQLRRSLLDAGYGPTLYGWARGVAGACDQRDLDRLMQLVDLAYTYQPSARTDAFIDIVRAKRVEDPSAADVRVMTIHQAKGLQFDVVILPQTQTRLIGQTPRLVVGRPGPTERIGRVCSYVSQQVRDLLPRAFAKMFDDHTRQVVEESLCVLYVAMTRAVHALHIIIPPSRENEKALPTNSAGLLRAALFGTDPVEPNTVLYEHGNPDWFQAVEANRPRAAREPAPTPSPAAVALAPSPPQRWRGLERLSPSQLEGGPRIHLATQLRWDTQEALDRGSLIHACFQQIEWLEAGVPDDDTLKNVVAALPGRALELPQLLAQFRAALERPAIAALLSQSTYKKPAADNTQAAVHLCPGIAQPHWKVWRERSFALREGPAILSGLIDRLVVLFDGDRPVAADVVDFKTDRLRQEEPGAVASRVAVYQPQLEAYRHAVAKLFRLDPKRISARLAFVEHGIVEES